MGNQPGVHAVSDDVVGQQVEIFRWATNLVFMLLVMKLLASKSRYSDGQPTSLLLYTKGSHSPPPIYHEFLLLGSFDFVDPLHFIRVW